MHDIDWDPSYLSIIGGKFIYLMQKIYLIAYIAIVFKIMLHRYTYSIKTYSWNVKNQNHQATINEVHVIVNA